MGQLVDSKGDPYTGLRRHTDPPNLWLNVLTGSILLHALAILSVRTSIVPLSPPPSTQAIPVDLIEVPATVASPKSIHNLKTASKQGATSSLQPQGRVSVRRYVHTPVSPPSPLVPFTRSSQPGIRSSGGTVPDGIRRSRLASSPQPFTTPLPSTRHPGSTASGPSPGPTNSPQEPTSPSTPLTSPSNSPGGQGLAMTFVKSQVATGGTNIPDFGRGAKPKINHQVFPDVTYKAQTRKLFGKVVDLEVTISETGQVQAAKIQRGSGDAEYDELVKEQLLNWEFEPAYQAGKPVYSFLDISVKLDPG